MGKAIATSAMLVLALAMTGCGLQKGETRATYKRGDTQVVKTTAPRDGDYALYTASSRTPVVVQLLHKGDPLGFEKNEDGRVRAIAGTYSTTLDSGTVEAYWKLYENETSQKK
jgi:hypothetical protein